MKQMGERSAGNPHAAFDVAGTGDVARHRPKPARQSSTLPIADDLTATWLLELWLKAPTPAKAARLRVSAVERLLKQHRIRRVNAEVILRTLRQPAIKVPDGVAAAAGIHIHSLIVRLQVVSRELNDAKRKLDELCTAIGETGVASEERAEHRDVAILRSLPGIGRINLATLLAEASGPLSR